jgi:Glu-tRNA(Gln) amidotransferase subunit E-like FAD-binding protein
MEIKPGYTQITNYLRNELEITRDYVEKVLDKSIANTIKQFLTEKVSPDQLDRLMSQTVQQIITDNKSTWNSMSTKTLFDKAIKEEIAKHVGNIISEKFEIKFTVTPRD